MKIEFPGQSVIVSGAAHGFGRAIAQAFAARGARVYACDIRTGSLAETVQGGAGQLQAAGLDVTDRAAVEALVQRVVNETGRVDVVVNNAGGVLGQVGRPLEQVSPAEWQAIFDVNVNGAFWLSQAAAPHMKARKYGRIVNISSGAGLGVSLTGIQAYASAKAAQIGLTRQLAHELGEFGITVNNVAPGFVRSNPTTERQWESYGPEGQQRLLQNIALKRLGSPDDIAHAVLFFASEYAGWVSGQVLSVDGGK
ncbi:SDR family oxidoreductase [Deinococcus cavernae]|uniref:SDR family oxidoreductase n=1 Tax=Deinococcus cavernae TaxID=2320857 RepID=A0A418VGM2_9DEIO|nr:SDR family oxidoreductase [Deinococcus cavernae]RJF75285.1 SDR family oxidoreductase [Deinococcus cavernae]